MPIHLSDVATCITRENTLPLLRLWPGLIENNVRWNNIHVRSIRNTPPHLKVQWYPCWKLFSTQQGDLMAVVQSAMSTTMTYWQCMNIYLDNLIPSTWGTSLRFTIAYPNLGYCTSRNLEADFCQYILKKWLMVSASTDAPLSAWNWHNRACPYQTSMWK